MKSETKLVIGSAQFGMAYGITNKIGVIKENEIKHILEYAYERGITTIDTAAAYGRSEEVLGNIHQSSKFDIDTKISSKSESQTVESKEILLDKRIEKSLNRLNRKKVRVLYFHDIGENMEEALIWANRQREKGIIEKVGISIYGIDDIEEKWLEYIDAIQIPMSIYDRRAEIEIREKKTKGERHNDSCKKYFYAGIDTSRLK